MLFTITTTMKRLLLSLLIFIGAFTAQSQIDTCAVAGEDSTIFVCPDDTLNLFDGLAGNYNTNGIWYNPVDSVVANPYNFDPFDIPGQYNFTYINQHPGCLPDTATMSMVVEPAGCDFWNWGIQEFDISGISVYPNPVHNRVTVQNVAPNVHSQYRLCTLDGTVIQRSELPKSTLNTIDISHLKPGVYWLHIWNLNASGMYKLLKE